MVKCVLDSTAPTGRAILREHAQRLREIVNGSLWIDCRLRQGVISAKKVPKRWEKAFNARGHRGALPYDHRDKHH
jgi:hypothetical protein